MIKGPLAIAGVLVAMIAGAQVKSNIDFETYNPPSSLVVPQHVLTKAKFPFIDIHNHQNNMSPQVLNGLTKVMDTLNMIVMINLSGSNGDRLKQSVANIKSTAANRFLVFANINFDGIGQPDWSQKAAAQLDQDVKNGAAGLKIFKTLGISVKDNQGKRVPVDDVRLDPIWKKAGELKIPVLIHTADPKQFWEPLDSTNERWLELVTRPGRKRSNTDPAPWQQLIDEQHRMFKKHPGTTFINAHFGWYANDLRRLSKLMDEFKNTYVEFGAVIAEIGRQPIAANQFFTKYQDRILFGKDSWVPEEYNTYFRVLETKDEYFPYHKKYHAFWAMYGMGLPDDILKKIYYKNALRLLPMVDSALFPK
ncbi:amidohydrolase [Segetibacter sp. 3557_3]|uniref:amidohydrolase family protein n=1 Tax=Segetibacter sp. 3557_3 TaxID=2547429 RepID=UPI0010589AE4|nr:amidohydrolase family protein [Segetibacter sp. 3557_3]TDH19735.1 amidohydrolase [Segetibacter sp. 3557_3]